MTAHQSAAAATLTDPAANGAPGHPAAGAPAVPGPAVDRAGAVAPMTPERREAVYLRQTRSGTFTARQERRYAKKQRAAR